MSKVVDKNMLVKANTTNDLKYYDGKDEHFAIYGFNKDLVNNYQRLTKEEALPFKETNDSVYYHSNNSTGIHLMFETDSLHINIKAKIHDDFILSNMSNYGMAAFSLYIYSKKAKGYVLYNVSKFAYRALDFDTNLATFTKKEMRKFIIYFPSYVTIDKCEIGLDENAIINPIYHQNKCKIGVYGTSIAQGCDASNSGLCYSNIISRKLDVNVYNLAFSGGALQEKEMAHIINSRNFDILIIDTEANAGIDETLKNRLTDFLDILFNYNKNLKVILCSRVYYSQDLSDLKIAKLHQFYVKYLKDITNSYKNKGYNIRYLDGRKVLKFSDISFSVDGIHPDSYVLNKIANANIKLIKEVM